MKSAIQMAPVAAVAMLLCGCLMHTVVGGGRDESPDRKWYLTFYIHGAPGKAFVDKTEKQISLTIWPTAGEPEKQKPLFFSKHIFVGADIGCQTNWMSTNDLWLTFYDYGDRVTISEALASGIQSNYIATVKIHRDSQSGKFAELP